ncbi:hypothetical protein ACXHQJ_14640 [Vibrio vulnificus]|nr:hypothetical protein [Vibrio cholerae]HEJ2449335.1 hypothetical protein [Vibrio cholerae]HEJ2463684.1 hypothetical protein [Vibrio cholerae]
MNTVENKVEQQDVELEVISSEITGEDEHVAMFIDSMDNELMLQSVFRRC